MPIELCAHTLYTQLVDFKLNDNLNTSLKTICITSLELDTVKTLCDLFSSYNENYSTTSWAIPSSPFINLLQDIKTHRLPQKQQTQQKAIPFANNTNLGETTALNPNTKTNFVKFETLSKEKETLQNQNINQIKPAEQNENINTHITPTTNSSHNTSKYEQSRPERIVRNDKVTIFNTKASSSSSSMTEEATLNDQTLNNLKSSKTRTISENSNASLSCSNESSLGEANNSSTSNTSLTTIRHVIKRSEIDTCCLFCQQENTSELISCGNQVCKGAYCDKCILKYMSAQKSQKCPSCKLMIDTNVLANLRDQRSSSSSSTSPNRISMPNNLLKIDHKIIEIVILIITIIIIICRIIPV